MGRRREPNGRRKRLDPIVEQIVKEESELYFRKIGVSARDIYALARDRVAQLNVERKREGQKPVRPASRTVVWRRLVANTNYENAKRRLGGRKAKLLFKPHQSYAKPTEILEVVIIDDTVVDCFVIDDKEKTDDGKPIVLGRARLAIPPSASLSRQKPSIVKQLTSGAEISEIRFDNAPMRRWR